MTGISSLGEFFESGGYAMWPLLATAFIVLSSSGRAWLRLRRTEPADHRLLEARIDGVLFWGFYALVIGVLGTIIGIGQLAKALQLAGGTAPSALVWSGLEVALTTTIFGSVIFAVAFPAWYALRRRWLRLRSA